MKESTAYVECPMPLARSARALVVTTLLVAAAGVALAPSAARAQVVSLSPDITIEIDGLAVPAADEDVAVDNQLGIVLLEDLGSLPQAADVVAFGMDIDGDRLLAFDTTVELPGSVVVRRGDVVRYDGASYTIEFDASAAGLPTGAMTDAVSLSPSGLLLSFDTTVDLGGLVVAREDLVRWNGASFSLAFDGSAEGLAHTLDIDGAQDAGGGSFLLSFDTSGEAGGVVFADEDVVRFDGSSFSLAFDASNASASWGPADADGVLVPEPTLGGALATGTLALSVLARPRRRGRDRGA